MSHTNKIFCLAYLILIVQTFYINKQPASLQSPLDDVSAKIKSGIYKIQYSLHTDDTHLTMDCVKITYNYDSSVFGIFHAVNSRTHFSQLYYAQYQNTSNKWKNTVKLSDRGSQGTVVRAQKNENKYGFFVGYQLQNEKGNKIAIRYYENQQKLKINNFLYQYQLVAIVSNKQVTNVGTVSIQQIQLVKEETDPKFNQYRLSIKFHYSPDGSHDFPGFGYVNVKPTRDFVDKTGKWIGGCFQNYRDWQGYQDSVTQGALRQAGCLGKIGQRDFFFVGTQKYYFYQCNLNPAFDWYSWRIVMYSPSLKQARPLGLVLGNDIDIANPHISLISKQNNSYDFVMSFFLPSQGTGPDKQAKAGQCLVYTKFTYP